MRALGRAGAFRTGAPIVLDTNVWIGAVRDASARRTLDEFLAARGHRVVMLSVVAQELASGARSRRRLHELGATLAPFEDDGRTLPCRTPPSGRPGGYSRH